MVKKLNFVILAACVLASVHSVQAQQVKKLHRIGYLSALSPSSESIRSEAIRRALHELGYVEGQNIAIEYRYSDGKTDRAPELAAELVRLKVDVIVVAGGDVWTRAAKNATKTIPIVMAGVGMDPVASEQLPARRILRRQDPERSKPCRAAYRTANKI